MPRADDLVDLPGGHPAVVVVDGVGKRRQQVVHALAGQRADLEHRRLAQEVQALPDLVGDLEALLGVERLPLVEQHDDRAAGRVDALGQALVLMGDADGGVDHEQGHVGRVDRLQCSDERVVLGALVDAALRRMPAVSMKRTGPSGVSTTVSIGSRVVPGMSWTTERSSPMSRLNRVDLPTFGRPTSATENTLPRRRLVGARRRRRPSSASAARCRAARRTAASSRSPVPRPCSALTGHGSPSPRLTNSQTLASRLVSSTLLATSSTGCVDPAQQVGDAAVLLGDAHPASTTNSTASASRIARSLWLADLRVEVAAARQPTAGVDQQERLALPLGLDLLAVAGDARLLLDDGLPRPTMRLAASTCRRWAARRWPPPAGSSWPRLRAARARSVSAPRRARPSVAHDLDRPGQVGGRGAVEEAALREADVGQQVAVTPGSAASTRARSAPTIRPVTPMLPPKNSLAHGDDPDVGAVERGDSGPSTPGAERRR